ncbi:MAG: chemotaxis response regulator protein-glutamate methylesterase [Alphaproteobacteria bacterium]|nr:chemotaxis response regulator protein-glutamate methylesterase [Alphaproteobacteria bacterium]
MSFVPPSAQQTAPPSPQVRVMIVDDSLVIRGFISRALDSDPAFMVVATASNGQIAIDTLRRTPADVVILDIEMPVMDGLMAIPKLKEIDPAVQIVMASTLTQRNADISIKALSLGATDYLPKPSAREMAVPGEFQRALREKVKELGAVAWRKNARQTPQKIAGTAMPAPVEKKKIVLRPMPLIKPDVIAIGSSTGGPQALFEVIKSIGKDLPQPIVITQHMPPSFTTILAEHITRQCNVICAEAKEGEVLRSGYFYIAPGDFHMLIAKKPEGPTVHLVKDPPENFCRPSVDPMLRSLVDVYGGRILTVILTGMGQDGTKGGEAVVHAGGAVIAQDEATSVVWGMPGAVALAGLCSAIYPIGEIGSVVRQLATKGQLGGRA